MSFGKVISLMRRRSRKSFACRFSFRACSAIRRSMRAGIEKPKDEGKRVGIPEWAQTAGIYVRGMLQHDYGVESRASSGFRRACERPGA